MRTTVNIPDDLLADAKVLAARTHTTLSSVVEDALRVLLIRQQAVPVATEWTFPTGNSGGLQPGVDLEDKEAMAELLGDNVVP